MWGSSRHLTATGESPSNDSELTFNNNCHCVMLIPKQKVSK